MKSSRGNNIPVVVVLLAAYMLVYFHRTMTGVMKPEIDYYSSYYGVEPSMLLAVMASAYFYGYAASHAFTGPLLYYYGVRRVGSLMLALLGLATLVMSLPNPLTLVAGRILIGVSAAVAFLSYMRTSALGFDISMQGRLASYALFAGSLSTILASYPLRLLLNAAGVAPALIILALLAFILAVMVYATSRDEGRGRDTGSSRNPLSTLRLVAGDRHIWGAGFAGIATYGVGLAYQSAWGQIHLEKAFAMDKNTISIYIMVIAVVFTVSCIPAGYLSDKLKRRKPFLIASASASAASWLLMYLSTILHSTQLLLASLVTLGVSLGLHIVAPTMAKEPYDPGISGTAVSFFNIILFTGIAVIQNTFTIIDPVWSIIASLLIALAGIISTIVLTKETYKAAGT